MTGRASYDTYGQPTVQTGQSSPYTYTGREYEPATGLYHYRARWYDPATGRFTSEDPVPAANLYAYADGKPTTLNDPTGLLAWSDGFASQVIIGALSGAAVGFTGSLASELRCGASLADAASASIAPAVKGALFGAVGGAVVGRIQWFSKVMIEAPRSVGIAASGVGAILVGWLSTIVYDAATDSPDVWADTPDWKKAFEIASNAMGALGDLEGAVGQAASDRLNADSCPYGQPPFPPSGA